MTMSTDQVCSEGNTKTTILAVRRTIQMKLQPTVIVNINPDTPTTSNVQNSVPSSVL